MIEELRPVFATLPPSAMRMELTRMVSSRLALPESLAEQLLAARRAARRPAAAERARARCGGERRRAARTAQPRARRAVAAARTPSGRSWRCASPRRRRERLALEGLDVDEHFSSELLRRAARHLRDGSLREPMATRAGRPGRARRRPRAEGPAGGADRGSRRASRPDPAMLEVQRLQLELARVDRQIQQARGQRGRRRERAGPAPRGGQARVRPRVRAGARGDGGQGGVRVARPTRRPCAAPVGTTERRWTSRLGARKSQTRHKRHRHEHMFV